MNTGRQQFNKPVFLIRIHKAVSPPDFWSRGPGFESGISHNDPDALRLQNHCVIK